MPRKRARPRPPAGVQRLEPRRLLSAAAPRAYYLSPTGSDSADGATPATAWRTLAAVDAVTLYAGDRVLLRGGGTFPGTLTLGPADAGTAADPITVSSYGTGLATISSGGADGIDVTDTSGVGISNLVVVGSSSAVSTSTGIKLFDDLPAATPRLANGVSIDSVDVSGYGFVGIAIGSATVTTGFDGVRVTNSSLHNDDDAGLFSYAGTYTANPAPYGLAHADLYVGDVTAYANAGHAGSNDSGSGIELGSVQGATVEHCTAYANGANNNSTGGGPVGIWTYDSDGVVIQSNESYGNLAGHKDGDGFDLDGGTTDAVLQDNYSHDNAGSGILLCQFAGASPWADNVVRYNVSQNDGGPLNYPAIDLWAASTTDTLTDAEVYGNTIYDGKTGSAAPKGIEVDVATTAVHFRNNIVDVTAGGTPVLVKAVGTGLLFQGNDYWAGSAAALGISWLGKTFATLPAWLAAATPQERVGTAAVGLAVDPELADAGGGGTIGFGNDLTTLSAYRIAAGSPLMNAGVNLATLGVTHLPTADYFGQPVPDASAYDVGADQVVVGPLMLTSAADVLELSSDGKSVQVWTTATATGTAAQTVPLSALTGVTVPAGTSLAINATNGSLPSSIPVTFAAGSAATTVTQIGTSATLAAVVPNGATVRFAGTQSVGSLAVAAGGKATVADPAAGGHAVMVVGSLALGGTLDLTDNDLVVTAGNLATLSAAAAAAAGYAGGAWTGHGLTSSSAAADAARVTGAGVIAAPSATTFDGVPVPAGAVLAKDTFYGDANLDGRVDIADYTRLDAGFLAALTGWANGDANYDGTVDGSDYALIDNAFNAQQATMALAAAPAAVPAAAPAVLAAPAARTTAAATLAAAAQQQRDRAAAAKP